MVVSHSGGGLEPNEESSDAAVREVVEEAGVKGILGRCLGTFEVRVMKMICLGVLIV
jgi:8-oxo-dGTP pyrophosphatase MutT (NUDIX family)